MPKSEKPFMSYDEMGTTPVPTSRMSQGLARFARTYVRQNGTSPEGARFTREINARRLLSGAYNNRNQSFKGGSPTAHK